jgi:hypothetical protein
MSLRALMTSVGNSVRRVGSSYSARRHCRTEPLHGPARDSAHSFVAHFEIGSRPSGRHSCSFHSSARQTAPLVGIGACVPSSKAFSFRPSSQQHVAMTAAVEVGTCQLGDFLDRIALPRSGRPFNPQTQNDRLTAQDHGDDLRSADQDELHRGRDRAQGVVASVRRRDPRHHWLTKRPQLRPQPDWRLVDIRWTTALPPAGGRAADRRSAPFYRLIFVSVGFWPRDISKPPCLCARGGTPLSMVGGGSRALEPRSVGAS